MTGMTLIRLSKLRGPLWLAAPAPPSTARKALLMATAIFDASKAVTGTVAADYAAHQSRICAGFPFRRTAKYEEDAWIARGQGTGWIPSSSRNAVSRAVLMKSRI